MSEYEPRNEEEVRLYYKWQFAQLKTGEPTWIVRNFEADFGRVHDLYTFKEGAHREGFVENEYGYGCDVYKSLGRKSILLAQGLQLEEAKDRLMEEL